MMGMMAHTSNPSMSARPAWGTACNLRAEELDTDKSPEQSSLMGKSYARGREPVSER